MSPVAAIFGAPVTEPGGAFGAGPDRCKNRESSAVSPQPAHLEAVAPPALVSLAVTRASPVYLVTSHVVGNRASARLPLQVPRPELLEFGLHLRIPGVGQIWPAVSLDGCIAASERTGTPSQLSYCRSVALACLLGLHISRMMGRTAVVGVRHESLEQKCRCSLCDRHTSTKPY